MSVGDDEERVYCTIWTGYVFIYPLRARLKILYKNSSESYFDFKAARYRWHPYVGRWE